MKTGWGGGSQICFLARSLARWWMSCSLLGGGQNPTDVGARGGPLTPRVRPWASVQTGHRAGASRHEFEAAIEHGDVMGATEPGGDTSSVCVCGRQRCLCARVCE